MPRLDSVAVDELRELMGEDFAALIAAFEADSGAQIDAIDTAVSSADAECVRRQAHGLRGACINLGANDLAELCERIEEFGRIGDCATARTLVPALRREFESLRATLAGIIRH